MITKLGEIKVFYLIILNLLFFTKLKSQNLEHLNVANMSDSVYRVSTDVLDFIFVGSLKDKERPLVVFITGSANMPVLFSYEKNFYYLMDTNTFQSKIFNYIVATKNGVPLVADYEKVKSNSFIDSDTLFSVVARENTLDKLSHKYENIIGISKQIINPKQVFLMGHSQGSRIVINMASKNPELYDKVACLNMSPLGRLYSYYISSNDSSIYNYLTNNPELDSLVWNETAESWLSFSRPHLHDLMDLKLPCFIGYGTADNGCIDCDIYALIRAYNNRLYYKVYPKLDHSFFLVNEKELATPESKVSKWDEVIRDVYNWFLE